MTLNGVMAVILHYYIDCVLNSLDYIFSLLSHISHHFKALNTVICADVLLRN